MAGITQQARLCRALVSAPLLLGACGPSVGDGGGTGDGSGSASEDSGSTQTTGEADVPEVTSCGDGQRDEGELCLIRLETNLPPQGLRKGDFNGDGNLDVAYLAPEAGSVALHVFAGDGTGAFSPAPVVVLDSGGTLSLVAEFGGDAATDVALVDVDSGVVSTFINRGQGAFDQASVSSNLDAGAPWNVALTLDADGDGRADLLTEPVSGGDILTVLTNDGGGAFTNAGLTAPVAEACTYTAASPIPPFSQFMGGLVFLAGECSNGPAVEQRLTLTWTENPGNFIADFGPTTGEGPSELIVGDFDGEGNPDLFVWNVTSQTLGLYSAGFVGSFQHKRDFTLPDICEICETSLDQSTLRLSVGDMDGDPTADLLLVLGETLYVGLNPLTETPTWYSEPIFAPRKVVGDFNNDGADDVLVEQSADRPVILLLSDP